MADNEIKYVIDFPISYANFAREKHLNVVGTEQLNKWADDVVNGLRLNNNPDDIMKFFQVSEDHRADIVAKRYKIIQFVMKNDTEKKILLLRETLTITNGIIL